MPKLGIAQTNKFSIGTAEVRYGPMSLANKLVQSHSAGAVDDMTLEVSQDSVDLDIGFPQVTVDTAIIRQGSSLTATLREYSRRNMKVLTGGAADTSYSANVSSLVVADAAAAAVVVNVTPGDGANFSEGDLVTIYTEGNPADLTIALIASIATDALTLSTDTPLLFDYNGATETVHIFTAQPIAIGAISSTNYMAVQFVQLDREFGRPLVGNFWKASIGAGMTLGSNATDFSSTELNLKLLQPAASEYGTGGALEHLASIVPTYPVGFIAAGGDV